MEPNSLARTVDRYTTIAELQSLCRGEMAAVESYIQALESTSEGWVVAHLVHNLASHEGRVQILVLQILALGGDPPEGAGPWGALLETLEGVAALSEGWPAVSLLEQGEADVSLKYQSNLQHLDLGSRRLVRDYILPQQRQTHHIVSEIRLLLSS